MNEEIRFLSEKSENEVIREWDLIAPERDAQVAAESDVSFTTVLQPWVLSRLGKARTVIDVGCGTGRLTSSLNRSNRRSIGLDPSASSIAIAREHDSKSDYVIATVEEWAAENPEARFDVVVANMVLMDVLRVDDVCAAIAQLGQGGKVLLTLTHPAFWPLYWGYASNPGFDYSRETLVEAPFKTRSHEFALTATHVHRPLSQYLNALQGSGLELSHFEELRGPEDPEVFPFPRFIGIEAEPYKS